MVRRFALIMVLVIMVAACRSAFFVGEEGEYLVVVDKKVPSDAGTPTLYTVKNITADSRFLNGSRFFNVYSRHVYHLGDTVQLFLMETPKRRGQDDRNEIVDKKGQSSP